MKYLSGNEIRQKYLDFFKERGHLVLPSASLIPHDDPTHGSFQAVFYRQGETACDTDHHLPEMRPDRRY